MSWTMGLYDWLITCRDRIWTPQSSNQQESRMEMGLKPHEETEDSSATCFATGIPHPLKWWNSNFTSKCPFTSPDNTSDIEQPQSTSCPPDTPSYRKNTIIPEFSEVNLK